MTKQNFHAVMLDECGHEFGASVFAHSKSAARAKLRENYPESRGIVQLESQQDTADREARIFASMWDAQDEQERY